MKCGQVNCQSQDPAPVFGISLPDSGFKDQVSPGNPCLRATQSAPFKITERRRIAFHQVLRGPEDKPGRAIVEGASDLVAGIDIRLLPRVNNVKISFAHQLTKLLIVVAKEVDAPGPFRIQRDHMQRRACWFRITRQGTQITLKSPGSGYSNVEVAVLRKLAPHGAVQRDNVRMADGENPQRLAH